MDFHSLSWVFISPSKQWFVKSYHVSKCCDQWSPEPDMWFWNSFSSFSIVVVLIIHHWVWWFNPVINKYSFVVSSLDLHVGTLRCPVYYKQLRAGCNVTLHRQELQLELNLCIGQWLIKDKRHNSYTHTGYQNMTQWRRLLL